MRLPGGAGRARRRRACPHAARARRAPSRPVGGPPPQRVHRTAACGSNYRSAVARAVGINHVALEVGDLEEALAFYGRLFDFGLRSKSATMAFIDLGDQFLAL